MNNNLPQEKILEVKDLRISFRTGGGTVKAVRGISFSLYKGRTLAIVGESGSGKSVTSKAILGILANNKIVEGGQIIFDGKGLLKLDEAGFSKLRGVKISMIFQDPLSSLNPIMIVGNQLTEEMKLKHKADKRNAKRGLSKLNRYMAKIDAETASKLVALLKEKGEVERDSLNEFLPLFEKTAEATFLERVEKAKEAIADLDAFVEAVANS
ncbi:MAG: ABC transporter ATP-binding protein, partial [Bacilli bacterium]|nr:ABC transporter ATP-binding protein [Bacilli bacterium]